MIQSKICDKVHALSSSAFHLSHSDMSEENRKRDDTIKIKGRILTRKYSALDVAGVSGKTRSQKRSLELAEALKGQV